MFSELLSNIRRYLIGYCTLKDLESWVLSNLQRILDSGDDVTIQLANQIDADLVEFGEGLLDVLTLREHLQRYLSLGETFPFVYRDTEPHDDIQATATAETIKTYSEVPGVVVDLPLVHEFA